MIKPSRILITPRSLSAGEGGGHSQLTRLRAAGYELVTPAPGKQPSETQLLAAVPGCVGYLAGVEPVTATVLEAACDLRVIARNGTGIDNIDLVAAQRLGIKICRAEGANARGVAELALGLMLAVARAIPASDCAIKNGGWQRITGLELEGKTLGLIGCGRIGKTVAGFALAFGMKVLAYDAFPDSTHNPSPDFAFVPLEAVLQQAEVLSLHCPPAAGGPLINSRTLALIKPGLILINTARAELVDEGSVLAALETGQLAGYGVDVFPQEPPKMSPLLAHSRVIATPHAGGLTQESVNRAVTVAVDALLRELEGSA